jgi:hypothetical protein
LKHEYNYKISKDRIDHRRSNDPKSYKRVDSVSRMMMLMERFNNSEQKRNLEEPDISDVQIIEPEI